MLFTCTFWDSIILDNIAFHRSDLGMHHTNNTLYLVPNYVTSRTVLV